MIARVKSMVKVATVCEGSSWLLYTTYTRRWSGPMDLYTKSFHPKFNLSNILFPISDSPVKRPYS